MTDVHSQVIPNGRSNVTAIQLQDDGIPIEQLSPITRITLKLHGETTRILDSSIEPEIFNWNAAYVAIQIGLASMDNGKYWGTLVTYDPSNIDGLTWTNNLFIELATPC